MSGRISSPSIDDLVSEITYEASVGGGARGTSYFLCFKVWVLLLGLVTRSKSFSF